METIHISHRNVPGALSLTVGKYKVKEAGEKADLSKQHENRRNHIHNHPQASLSSLLYVSLFIITLSLKTLCILGKCGGQEEKNAVMGIYCLYRCRGHMQGLVYRLTSVYITLLGNYKPQL